MWISGNIDLINRGSYICGTHSVILFCWCCVYFCSLYGEHHTWFWRAYSTLGFYLVFIVGV